MASRAELRRHLETAPPILVAAVVLALCVAIMVLDVASGPQVSTSFFYVIPLAMVTWRFGPTAGVATALAAAALWLIVDVGTGISGSVSISIWNAVVRFGFFITITLLLVHLRSAMLREAELARIDPLTGLANRRAFADAAAHELARSLRSGERITIAMVDLDDLKLINDHEGHAVGDEAITAIARVLESAVRTTDLTARLGGDEFALLAIGELVDADALLARISGRVAEVSVRDHRLSCSIGAVNAHGGTVDDWLERADRALYDAKRAGKGRVVLHSETSAVR
jgi:diguanylate cyclase (GGDEF)-like protein